jgi:hypothetical protein
MEKHPHPFDEFLKETLKGHQMAPPEEAKKAFLREASTIIATRKGWLKWYYIPILVVFISGIVAVLYFRNSSEPVTAETITTENNMTGQNQEPDNNPNINNDYNSNSTQGTNPEFTSTPIQTSLNEPATKLLPVSVEKTRTDYIKPSDNSADLPVNNSSGVRPEFPVNAIGENPIIPDAVVQDVAEPKEMLSSETTSSRLALDSLAVSLGSKADTVDKSKMTLSDSASAMPPKLNTEAQKPMRDKPVRYFTASAYYLPEWMFNTVEGSKFVNNFGFEGIFYRGQISIRTGAGISISKGLTETAVEYNDYLGTYNKLDSVTFIFNESSHDFYPNFYMSEEKVWDSISRLDSTNVIKRYTYLQIPLVLGFDFWHEGKFTIGVRVGTIMSILLNSKQLSKEYNPGENQVIGSNRITPDQVSINWQAIGGINASARLTKSIFFEIEPQAKYYYQSIYEKSGINKKPWSLSIRTAIIYKF